MRRSRPNLPFGSRLVLLAPTAQPTLSFRRIPPRENRVSTPARDDSALGASIEAASNPISSIAPSDISPAPPPQRRLIARR
jgi:hypothetical protein